MPKDIQYLSKRRKNQLINFEYHCSINFDHCNKILIESTVSNIVSNVVQEATLTNETCDRTFRADHALSEHLNEHLNEFNELSVESGNSLNSFKYSLHQSEVQSNEDYNIETRDNFSTLTNILCCTNEITLLQDLQTLIIQHNIPHNFANELLKVLRKHGHIELPCDIRVLLRTPQNAFVHIKSMGDGHYVHFAFFLSLERAIKTYSKFINKNEIKLNINVDGLPISKSSNSRFWPIMVSIEDIDIYTSPIIVGVYHGMSKPKDTNEFLMNFVNDLIFLCRNGITVSNIKCCYH